MNEFIRNVVYEFAIDSILDALENGDPQAAAKSLREGIRRGWKSALMDSGMTDEMQAKLIFPL